MEVTRKFLSENHKKYNELYFGNKLVMPQFIFRATRRKLGHYCGSRNEILISTYYERSERDIIRVLIHEMIHQYIHIMRLRDTSTHGRVFNEIARRINKDGWEISARETMDEINPTNEKHYYHIIRMKFNNGRYFVCVVAKNLHEHIYNHMMRRIDVSDVIKYTSSNPIYSSFRQCRSRISGRYITENELDKYK